MQILLVTDTHYGYNHKTERIFRKLFSSLNTENISCVIHSGDIGSHKPQHVHSFFKLIREYIACPILCVLGNHDYYEYLSKREVKKGIRKHTFKENFESIQCHAGSYDITLLHDNPQIIDNVNICGFDSWYINGMPSDSNDRVYIPQIAYGELTDSYLSKRSYVGFNNCLDAYKPDMVNILVAHHNIYDETTFRTNDWGCNPRYMEFIKLVGFDYLIQGHTHVEQNFMSDDLCVINVGSGYNVPAYKILEIL